MPCYRPLQAYKPPVGYGSKKYLFTLPRGLDLYPSRIPCGQCVGCRLERSRQWAIRCVHEASLYDNNCFITLTYSPDYLLQFNRVGNLEHRDFQLFMKRLRKAIVSDKAFDKYCFVDDKVRFYHCGEYGSNFGRPHHHAILFGIDFKDKYFWKNNNGNKLYRSPELERLWPYGYSSVGACTFESAAYVARYIMKKITGDLVDSHYRKLDYSTGELVSVRPEYNSMSRRPGIAKGWFDLWKDDVYPSDELVIRSDKGGKVVRPPRYYDRQFELLYPDEFEDVKFSRQEKAKTFSDDNTPDRLLVREQVCLARLASLKRTIE